MKTLRIFSLITILVGAATISFAQVKSESIPVSGNCGMCKDNIEKAAKKAGATEANWNVDTKTLTLKYNSASSNTAKIQESIAAAGYDTRDVKAADAAYDKLHTCCKYDRKAVKAGEASPSTSPDVSQKSSGPSDAKDCCSKDACNKSETKKDCCKKSN